MSKVNVRPTTIVKYAAFLEALAAELNKEQALNLPEFILDQGITARMTGQLLKTRTIEPGNVTSGYILKDNRHPMVIARELAYACAKQAKEYAMLKRHKMDLIKDQTPEGSVTIPALPVSVPVPTFAPIQVGRSIFLSNTDVQLLSILLQDTNNPDLEHFASRLHTRLQQAS